LTFIGSFQGLRAELEEVVLFAQRLALKYNTTPRPSCQHFLTTFFQVFACTGKQLQNARGNAPPLLPQARRANGQLYPALIL